MKSLSCVRSHLDDREREKGQEEVTVDGYQPSSNKSMVQLIPAFVVIIYCDDIRLT